MKENQPGNEKIKVNFFKLGLISGLLLLVFWLGYRVLVVNFGSPSSSSNSGKTLAGSNLGLGEDTDGFSGERGQTVKAEGNVVKIDENLVNDGDLHPFSYYSERFDKIIYFFVVKASDDTYRVAANACEVCFGSQMGFTQVGDLIRCENCRTIYSKDQIALQKGGCNPRPIDADAQVESGQVMVRAVDIEAAADLF